MNKSKRHRKVLFHKILSMATFLLATVGTLEARIGYLSTYLWEGIRGGNALFSLKNACSVYETAPYIRQHQSGS